MQLRDLMVVLNGSGRDDVVLDVAIAIARRSDAHLSGFCPQELLFSADLGLALGGYPALVALPEAAYQLDVGAREKAEAIEANFREQLRRNDVRGDWQLAPGAAAEEVARRARSSDLLVLGQSDSEHPMEATPRYVLEDALMTSGRPVLLVPFAGRFETVGKNVLLGWNGSRESARAVHDALLLIEREASVTVLSIVSGRSATSNEVPGAEIAAHLARHGLKVSAARTVSSNGVGDADLLLNYASDTGADLLVVGAYGHSRVREVVLGGVSRALLTHMTLPVLMSH